MKIEDNFLVQEEFDKLQALMMDSNLDWHYNDGIVYGDTRPDGKIIYFMLICLMY